MFKDFLNHEVEKINKLAEGRYTVAIGEIDIHSPELLPGYSQIDVAVDNGEVNPGGKIVFDMVPDQEIDIRQQMRIIKSFQQLVEMIKTGPQPPVEVQAEADRSGKPILYQLSRDQLLTVYPRTNTSI